MDSELNCVSKHERLCNLICHCVCALKSSTRPLIQVISPEAM